MAALHVLDEEDDTDVETMLAQMTIGSSTQSHSGSKSALREELRLVTSLGQREPGVPSRNGKPRWRFTYNGTVYVTDETGSHLIAKWNLSENDYVIGPDVYGALNHPTAFTTHIVFVADHSGSMRNGDVAGFSSRTEALYKTLKTEFLEPQLQAMRSARGRTLGRAVVSLIQMSTTSHVAFERVAIDESLGPVLDNLATGYARYHGNYLPALQALDDLLQGDLNKQVQIVVLFLSDGAPSDHNDRACRHGVQVWTEADGRLVDHRGRPVLKSCGIHERTCRETVQSAVKDDCDAAVRRMGDRYGRERLTFHTVGFGPSSESFDVLARMAKVLPRSQFQKLGLSVGNLVTMFSSLTSTVTEMRTEGGGNGKTIRTNRRQESPQTTQAVSRNRVICEADGWFIYTGRSMVKKMVYRDQEYHCEPLPAGVTGVAMKGEYFASGAERTAHRCVEVGPSSTRSGEVGAVGHQLVGKETWYDEELYDDSFHKSMARSQAKAQSLAATFNTRLERIRPNRPELAVNFAPCCIYEVLDPHYPGGRAWIFAEPLLEGRFVKWNNNGGSVGADDVSDSAEVNSLPQTFSHFTWSVTGGEKLVCDLQGVWNATDGFTMTDPAIHHDERRQRKRRSTDKSVGGMDKFFKTHKCNDLCRELGLRTP